MTPEEAADLLGVPVSASRQQVERAFRRLARESHPDRLSGASMREKALAEARFVKATEARGVLLAAVVMASAAASAVRPARKHNWLLILTWVGLMLLAIAVSVVGSSLPLTVWEPLVRFGIMLVASVGFALTGARPWLILVLVSIAATAITTVGFTTFGSLLGMLLLAAPLYGLYAEGRGRSRQGRGTRATL